tara:strand:+ start:220 stop:507 length:288 start_codon:yes stop_codon:yes gene_type:complete
MEIQNDPSGGGPGGVLDGVFEAGGILTDAEEVGGFLGVFFEASAQFLNELLDRGFLFGVRGALQDEVEEVLDGIAIGLECAGGEEAGGLDELGIV